MSELKPCEAIEILEDIYPSKKQIVTGEYPEVAEALDMAIAALRRAQPENEPLTLEQLREMDGEPVWVHRLEDNQGWWVVIKSTERDKVTTDYGGYFEFADYGKTWLAYRRPPEMFIGVDLASGHDFTAYGRPPERSENE